VQPPLNKLVIFEDVKVVFLAAKNQSVMAAFCGGIFEGLRTD
jgi:hypothetical protein